MNVNYCIFIIIIISFSFFNISDKLIFTFIVYLLLKYFLIYKILVFNNFNKKYTCLLIKYNKIKNVFFVEIVK